MEKVIRIVLAVILTIVFFGMIILNQAKFGKLPRGERLMRVRNSKNYVNGEFRNLTDTKTFTSDKNSLEVMYDFLTKKKDNLRPEENIPVVKTDLKSLDP